MRATITMSCRLVEPEGKWENVIEVNAPDEKAIGAEMVRRMAKVLGEGGILEMHSLSAPSLHMTLIPLRRIVDFDVKAEISVIESGEGMDEAVKRAKAIADMAAPLKFPSKHGAN